MLRIKKGDNVQVISGADKGKTGLVEKVWPKKGTAYITGVGLYKKHIKPQAARDGKGGVYELYRPIKVNKIALIDPKTNKPTRVKFQVTADKKLRVATKSNEVIDKATK